MPTEDKKKEGKITPMWVLGITLALVLTFGGVIYNSSVSRVDAIVVRTNSLETANVEAVQRISKLEEAVGTIKTDTGDIKKDIKDILIQVSKR